MAEKTEAPTPRRREEARAKGQGVGRSRELSQGLTMGVGVLALASLLPGVAANLVTQTQSAVLDMTPRASNSQLMGATGGAILTVLELTLPLAVLVMVAGIAGNLVSGGLVFSYRAIRFDLSRINPIQGFKRLADRQALVRLGIASAKLAILAFISWQVVGSRVPSIVATQGSSAAAIAGTCLSAVFQLGLTITILLAVVSLVDFVVQRRRAQQSIRMTKQEVRQEYRESEGDPMIRSARRRRARQIAFARMMDAVPTSDVVVTNPTTLAVALKYDSLTMRAPKIVAKGQRLMADRIKQIAREHAVPVIEDKPLARALFSRPVGSEVPAHLYRAVARLLVLVHQARFATGGRFAGARSGGRPGTRGQSAEGARTAPAGPKLRSWWNAATAAATAAGFDSQILGSLAVDGSEAVRLYGGAPAPAGEPGPGGRAEAETDPAAGAAGGSATAAQAGVDADADADEAWLDAAALGPTDVDEEALAAAMAADELGDLTPDEIAQFEAGLVLGDDSTDIEDEELGR
jgi:flagellar biosynthetic protein FlhB